MRLFFIVILLANSVYVFSSEQDAKLDIIKRVYNLSAKECNSVITSDLDKKKFSAGKILFESKALSGDRDTSCKTCHLDEFGSTDGLPLAVGVGGEGEGKQRYTAEKGALVQRNAISLFGRGNKAFKVLFWDGKVHQTSGLIVSQFGKHIEGKFESPLELAAILPLVERDEFIGTNHLYSSNDIQLTVEDKVYYQRYMAVSESLRERFTSSLQEGDRKAREAFVLAGIEVGKLELSDIGKLLAFFISENFKCKESSWDRYVNGDKKALTKEQKKGAITFYGKGRCASCHSGPFFSDFDFHSIGVPQGGFGPHTRKRDIGRAAVTHKAKDLFKFRTPPLNQVKSSPPYGHNGIFHDIRSVVTHHFNPIDIYLNNPSIYKADYYEIGKLNASRDPLLFAIDISKEDDLNDLIEFLKVL